MVIVNKYDLNAQNSADIARFCTEAGYPIAGLLPHDDIVVQAMLQAKCVTELPPSPFSEALRGAWELICSHTGAAPSPFTTINKA